jgi:hypothetical protein
VGRGSRQKGAGVGRRPRSLTLLARLTLVALAAPASAAVVLSDLVLVIAACIDAAAVTMEKERGLGGLLPVQVRRTGAIAGTTWEGSAAPVGDIELNS